MRGSGRADVSKEVGTGGGDGNTGPPDELLGDRMGGHAHSHQRPPGSDDIGHGGLSRQEQRKRPGPEFGDELAGALGDVLDQFLQHLGGDDMHDDWVPRRALLGLEELEHRCVVQGIGPKSVDSLSGKSDGSAGS